MPIPDTRSSLVIVKSFLYKGSTKLWSNRYHFAAGGAANPTSWETFADNVVAAEKLIYGEAVTIVRAIGNDHTTASSTNPHGDAVFDKAYSVGGDHGAFDSGSHPAPGDAAALLRYATDARSTKNKPVYLFNYFHGCWFAAGSDSDELDNSQRTSISDFADAWEGGIDSGGLELVRCGPRGAVGISHVVNAHITHRDFPS